MTHGLEAAPGLWKSVWDLAEVWSETAVVQDLSPTLPRNQPLQRNWGEAMGISGLLQRVEAIAGPMLHPFRYGSRIPVLMEDQVLARFGSGQAMDAEWNEWLLKANRLENAHASTLGWLRSSLRGYPVIRAPQLTPGTLLTTFEMTTEFNWTRQERQSRLNFMSAPPGVSSFLGANQATAVRLDVASRELAAQLGQTEAWTEFAMAHERLDDSAKESLQTAKRELAQRLSPERIDAHEDKLALPRSQYRSHTTEDVVDGLSGSAREYSEAFEKVHRLLTLSACDVFSELVLFGHPKLISVRNVETVVPGKPIIEFETIGEEGDFVNLGEIRWLSNSGVVDAVRIEAQSLYMDVAEGGLSRIEGQVLHGTDAGWPTQTAPIPDLQE